MTIKQAAMWLCQPGIVSMIHDPTTKKALSVAVKALTESEHGTNLAEVGTDCISRQQAIDGINKLMEIHFDRKIVLKKARDVVEQLPPAQPEIVQCRNCKFASGDSRICMKFGHSPIGELDFCSFAERRENE